MNSSESDISLSVRAAWLHYAGGLRQREVAKRLGVTVVKVNRLIAKANNDGIVKVSIQGKIAPCVELEEKLVAKFGFSECIVVPNLQNEQGPFKSLAIAGAEYLRRLIVNEKPAFIGVGHGRTLQALVSEITEAQFKDTQFVSLLGGLTQNFAANPHDVIHRLAEKTGSQSFVMPLPLYANTVDDVKILLAQRGVNEVLQIGNSSTVKLVGIGAVNSEFSMANSGLIQRSELEEVQSKGGVGEILGSFFDVDGRLIETDLSQRTISVDIKTCNETKVVALAGGPGKVDAIRSVARSGYISCLITDEVTAAELSVDR